MSVSIGEGCAHGPGAAVESDEGAGRSALGRAVLRRADDVVTLAGVLLDGSAPGFRATSPEHVVTAIDRAKRVATTIVSRWLTSGVGGTEAELDWLSGLGTLAEVVSIADLAKTYLAWRDATLQVIREEAARLECDGAVLSAATVAVTRSCDASMVRMARRFDRKRRELEDALAVERARLAYDALHDPLTGLANRTLLVDRLAEALNAARRYTHRVALLFIDVDGFKGVNDRWGHDAGDEVLVALARRLEGVVRACDTAARLGGDEFVVLCGRVEDDEDARAIAERLLGELAGPIELSPTCLVTLSGSIGVVVDDGTRDARALLRDADEAMYAVKRAGGCGWELR